MGSFAAYAKNKIVDHFTGKAAWTMPTIYVALFVGDPEGAGTEVSGGSYARKATAAADWNTASGGATSNAQALAFPQATGSWGTVDYFALYDAASGGNRQPLRFRLIHDPAECAAVFPLTRWAGLLKEWSPAADEAPTAYVLVLAAAGGATPQTDAGIAMQTLLLAAVADGFGGCMLGAIDRPAIRAALNLPAALELLYAVALGKPAETCRLEAAIDGQTAYYRSADGIHHVPKLPLEALLVPED